MVLPIIIKMKVHRSFITSQATAAHERFIRALKELPGTSGVQRQFILDDLNLSIKQAELLKAKYPEHLSGQASIKVEHILARSLEQWSAISSINDQRNNLITTH